MPQVPGGEFRYRLRSLGARMIEHRGWTLTVLMSSLLACGANAAELRPIQSSGKASGSAVYKIERTIADGLKVALPTYPASIIIEPIVAELRFESGGKRFWLGPIAGSSHVRLRVRITQADKVVEKDFYQSSGAWSGTWTIGAADNYMLERVAHDAVEYVLQRPWESQAGQLNAGEQSPQPPAAESARAPSDAQPPASPTDSLYNDLIKLDELRKRGLITDAEYQRQKQRLLAPH